MRRRAKSSILIALLMLGNIGWTTRPAEAFAPCKFATIVGTPGDDFLVGTGGRDVIRGRGGNDTILGLSGNDIMCGNRGADYLNGTSGNDIAYGGLGPDDCKAERIINCNFN